MNKTRPTVPLGDVLRLRKEFITIDDFSSYKRPRVQLHSKGIVQRDEVPGALIKTKKQQVCNAGEFLVAEIDAKVGGFGVIPEFLAGSIVSSHYFLFVIDDAKLDRRFLDYFIRTPAFRNQVEAQGSTNYAAIRPSDVLRYTAPLPSLAEQQLIVRQIGKIETWVREAGELRSQAAHEAGALWRASLRRILLQHQCPHVPLQSVCNAIIDNLHSNPLYADAGVPCIRSPDVGWGTLNLETALKTDEIEYRRRTIRGEPQPDDIVLVREGGGTGKAALVSSGQRFSLGQRVMMLRPDKQKVLPKFFLFQLLSPLIQDDCIVPLSKGSAAPHLNIGSLRRFPFRLPALAEQRRIVADLEELQAQIEALKRLQAETTSELHALLPSVLSLAFAGGLNDVVG
jgi:type I restriction enzyme, S subunit